MTPASPMLVFIDANCGLCQRFALWADQRLVRKPGLADTLSWAAWGGQTHQTLASQRPPHWPPLPASPSGPTPNDRLEIYCQGRWFDGASAITLLVSHLHPPWSWLGKIAALLPQSMLSGPYQLIARYRRKLSSACQTAPAEFRQKILP
jgi:predicted DCC family thiol-disulfide oxidoreductase YuxK